MKVTAKSTNNYWGVTKDTTGTVKRTYTSENGETLYQLKLSDGSIKDFPAVFFWNIPDWGGDRRGIGKPVGRPKGNRKSVYFYIDSEEEILLRQTLEAHCNPSK